MEVPPVKELSYDTKREEHTAELLRYHQKFGHIPFRRLQAMARTGLLPKALATCPLPVCQPCLHGTMTKVPRVTKDSKIEPYPVHEPGDCVSVDILVSQTPGLIAQMSGTITKARYRYACVFVDQYSDFTYVHLMQTQSGDEALEAKRAYETYCDALGVSVKHYHADNGIFACKQWKNSCSELHQGLTFAGVNAHHQNGRAERKIRSLQDLTRCNLIHAHHRWPDAITANLWPYALRMACDSLNATPSSHHKHKLSPINSFSRSDVDVNPKHWQPFGCPIYKF